MVDLFRRAGGLALGLCLLAAAGLEAQTRVLQPTRSTEPVLSAGDLPEPLQGVGFAQRLGESLPLDVEMVDAYGRTVVLGDLLEGRPAVVVPVYYDCPMLCTMTTTGLTNTLRSLELMPGADFEIVIYSIDPAETPEMAQAARKAMVARYGNPEGAAGLNFLVGDAAAIARLSEAIGFSYEPLAETGDFAHTAGAVIATPQGQISRYFLGVEFPARDFRLALVEASEERIGSIIDQVYLYCFRYDPATGKYSAVALNLIRLGGVLTVLALALSVTLSLRRDRKRNLPLGTAEHA